MKYFNHKLLAALAIGLLFFSSCELDTTDPNYELRDEYVGDWNCIETSSQFGQAAYKVTISKDQSDSDYILIKNFYNSGTARVRVFNNNLSIPSQMINNTDSVFGSGTSTVDYDSFSLDYTVDDGATLDEVRSTYTPF